MKYDSPYLGCLYTYVCTSEVIEDTFNKNIILSYLIICKLPVLILNQPIGCIYVYYYYSNGGAKRKQRGHPQDGDNDEPQSKQQSVEVRYNMSHDPSEHIQNAVPAGVSRL